MAGRRTWLGGLAIAIACALAIGLAVERPARATGVKETEDAVVITIRLHRGRVEVEQPNGMIDGMIYVPIGRPVGLDVESEIPGAGLLLPELGLRVRAPGQLALRLNEVGSMPVLATGLGRPVRTELVALTVQAYESPLHCGSWPAEYEDRVQWGEQQFQQNGCPACHALEPDELGPSLHGLTGTERRLEGGETVFADVGYVASSITSPQHQVAAGYTRVAMPPFQLSQPQLDALCAYIASLR